MTVILLHWCISDVPIYQNNYEDHKYYLYESEVKPTVINEDLEINGCQ